MGRLGTGTLDVLAGGVVTSLTGIIGTAAPTIGPPARGVGTVTVSGAGSAWTSGQSLRIGDAGTGTLRLVDGGRVTTDSVTIGRQSGSIGTLIFGAAEGTAPAAAGTLITPTITFGSGTGTIVFNHTSADFELASAISGNGAVRQLAGTTTLSGASGAFAGSTTILRGTLLVTGTLGGNLTTISGGTLQIGNGGTTGALGTGNVINNASLVFNRSNDLTVGNAISGSGTLTKQGAGILTLTRSNSYSGGTFIEAGGIALGAGNALGSGLLTMAAGTTLGTAQPATNLANAIAIKGGVTFDAAMFMQLNGNISGSGALPRPVPAPCP